VTRRARPFVVAVIGAALAATAALPPSAGAYSRPGSLTRVSVSSSGAQADYTAAAPTSCSLVHAGNPEACSATISPDGRYVVFSSPATNLVRNDINLVPDVFVRDRAKGTTEIESVDGKGRPAIAAPDLNNATNVTGGSFEPDITPNGQLVAFTSNALNLVPKDLNLTYDIFVRDRRTKKIERDSVATGGAEANGPSTNPVLSADGRYVAFESDATNLVAGDKNGYTDIFVHDRRTGTTTRISVGAQGADANNNSYTPSISANGRYVSYTTEATNIVPGTAGQTVIVHDMKTRHDDVASVASGATAEDVDYVNGEGAMTGSHSLSADGRYVTYRAAQSTLVPNDSGFRASTWDIFVRDRVTRRTERVSVQSSGAEFATGSLPLTESESNYPAISPDGRFVAFYMNVTTAAMYGNSYIDIHDMQSRVTETVSIAGEYLKDATCPGYGQGAVNADPSLSVSSGGRYVAFMSCDDALVKGDTDKSWDVFVRDRGAPQAVDGLAMGQLAVAGARSTTGSAVYRPASGDLLVRVDDPGLSAVLARALPVVYGVQLTVRGTRYQVRADGAGGVARFGLFRADPVTGWSLVARLAGGLGTVGSAVEVSVPLADVGAARPADVRDLASFAGLGSFTTGPTVLSPRPAVVSPHRVAPLSFPRMSV
jgi:Tol biopolymer transport system component